VLVKAPGFDVDKAANDGCTPAYIAAHQVHAAALVLLIKAGCDVNQAAKDGWTPADVAARNGLTAAVAAAVALKENNDNKKKEDNDNKKKENNRKKKMKKKARAAAAVDGAVKEEEARPQSEAVAPELALLSSSVESERHVALDNTNQAGTLVGGGFDNVESDDEEVELCRCIRCLELEDSLS
jgi:ankyrin repeat protein